MEVMTIQTEKMIFLPYVNNGSCSNDYTNKATVEPIAGIIGGLQTLLSLLT